MAGQNQGDESGLPIVCEEDNVLTEGDAPAGDDEGGLRMRIVRRRIRQVGQQRGKTLSKDGKIQLAFPASAGGRYRSTETASVPSPHWAACRSQTMPIREHYQEATIMQLNDNNDRRTRRLITSSAAQAKSAKRKRLSP